ncbi:hypothetical protein, partial [Lysobacter xanthus]
MRLVVLLLSLCMPAIAWFSQRGTFGPTNGAVSDRYPTLLVAAGWAFSIWGLIFLLDIAYGIAQATGPRRRDPALARMAPWSALGFAATAAWMPLFSTGAYWLCVLVIFTALFGTARAAAIACSERKPAPGIARWALPLHAGWLTLASFLNLAQTIVAYRLLSTDHMLGWSLVLLVLATVLLLWINRGLRSLPYAAAAAWGLGAAYARQSQSSLPGAETAALAAMVAA